VPRLELVEPRRKHLGAPSYRAIGLLALGQPVFLLGGPAPRPLARLHPLFLRDLPLEVGEGPRETHCPHFRSVAVQPFYSAGVRLLCRDLRPLVPLLVAELARELRTGVQDRAGQVRVNDRQVRQEIAASWRSELWRKEQSTSQALPYTKELHTNGAYELAIGKHCGNARNPETLHSDYPLPTV